MSYEKAIKHKKTKRKPYRDSRRFDVNCRNHGRCSYCQGNRLYQTNKALNEADEKMKEGEK